MIMGLTARKPIGVPTASFYANSSKHKKPYDDPTEGDNGWLEIQQTAARFHYRGVLAHVYKRNDLKNAKHFACQSMCVNG